MSFVFIIMIKNRSLIQYPKYINAQHANVNFVEEKLNIPNKRIKNVRKRKRMTKKKKNRRQVVKKVMSLILHLNKLNNNSGNRLKHKLFQWC